MAMGKTAISWTNVTWNPVHGCHKVSEGCRNCYAETLSLQRGWTKKPWTAPNIGENLKLQEHKLNEPLKRKTPSMIFVNSMSDLWHPDIPLDYLLEIWAVMEATPRHVYQILTKRPETTVQRAGRWLWPDHVWQGVSVEDAKNTGRIDVLRQVPAQVRFLSLEPLLGPLPDLDLGGIHWVIVGGESGPGFRPMDMAWAREIRDQCVEQGVAFFFKQDSGYRTELRPYVVEEDGSKTTWEQFPAGVYLPDNDSGAAQLSLP
jgi:protein gp37